MSTDLTLSAEAYRCVPCSNKQGTDVRELIRMIPASIVLDGTLVGDEWYCCPICYEPKFLVSTRKARGMNGGKRRPKLVAKAV